MECLKKGVEAAAMVWKLKISEKEGTGRTNRERQMKGRQEI
jgi:hypothetical protein